MIRDVETMNFADIEKAINALGEKVKSFVLYTKITVLVYYF